MQTGVDAAKAAGDTSAQTATDAAGRQVITTGKVQVTVRDPRAAAEQVVTLVERAGGRVDGPNEMATSGDRAASVHLRVRVPAHSITATIDVLTSIDEVGQISISSIDVTADAQDLDARITAMRVSVDRMAEQVALSTLDIDLTAPGVVRSPEAASPAVGAATDRRVLSRSTARARRPLSRRAWSVSPRPRPGRASCRRSRRA